MHGWFAGPVFGVVASLLLTSPSSAVEEPKAGAMERAEACIAELRQTEDGQRLEQFLRLLRRDFGPLAAVIGDEATVLRQLAESVEPTKREANHARLHALLGRRLDDASHTAMHTLMDEMLACADAG